MPPSTFAAHAASFLLDISLKSLVLFGVAGLLFLALRRASAASRHALWLLTLVSLLCLPVFGLLLPSWSVPILQASRHSAQKVSVRHLITHSNSQVKPRVPHLLPKKLWAENDVPVSSVPITGSMPIGNFPLQTPIVPHRPVSRVWTIVTCVCLLWLAGTLVVLTQTLIALLAARRLVNRCHPVMAGPLTQAADMARQTLGLKQPLSVLKDSEDGSVAVPMTLGILRPVVLLPRGADTWPADRLRSVLLHEAAHVKRLDWATLLLARFACVVYWYHPLVWLAASRLREESEAACDDLVLGCGVPAPEYASYLLEIVQSLAVRPISRHATVAMAHRREVSQRLRTILAENQNRASLPRRSLTIAALVTLGLASIIAVIHPVASAAPPAITHLPQVPSPASTGVPPNIAAMMAGHSRWDRTLADGTRVRLLSVTVLDRRGNIFSSWTPDGILKRQYNPALNWQKSGMHMFRFQWGVILPSEKLVEGATFSVGLAGGSVGPIVSPLSSSGGRTSLISISGNYPDARTWWDLQLSLWTGPKTPLITASPRTGAIHRLRDGAVISMSPMRVHSAVPWFQGGGKDEFTTVMVTVPPRFTGNLDQYGFEVIGHDGRLLGTQPPGTNIQASGKLTHIFLAYNTSELPLDQVKEIRVTYRPSHTMIFRHITLRPKRDPLMVTYEALRARLALRTRFLKPGVWLVPAIGGRLRLSGGISRDISYLGDLQGAVNIDTPRKALDFVRLMTSCNTYDLWPTDLYVEVMDRHQAKLVPNYGHDNGSNWNYFSGCMGILSETAAKRSRLSAARVESDHNGYVITRWLLRNSLLHEDNSIVLVEEKVSHDGKYERRKIKERPAPILPNTRWFIMPPSDVF